MPHTDRDGRMVCLETKKWGGFCSSQPRHDSSLGEFCCSWLSQLVFSTALTAVDNSFTARPYLLQEMSTRWGPFLWQPRRRLRGFGSNYGNQHSEWSLSNPAVKVHQCQRKPGFLVSRKLQQAKLLNVVVSACSKAPACWVVIKDGLSPAH